MRSLPHLHFVPIAILLVAGCGGSSGSGTAGSAGSTATGGSAGSTGSAGSAGTGGNATTGGSAGTGGTGGSSGSAGTAGSAGSGGGNACTAAGGTCVAITPDACPDGTLGDATIYSCGGGDGVGCCLPLACTPGQDQTCNFDPAMNSFAGHCNPDGTCTCTPPFVLKPNGKCGK